MYAHMKSHCGCKSHHIVGVWASLVSHSAWDRDIAGSNPATPTNLVIMKKKMRKPHPQPPKYYWLDSDNCWDCKNRNNCGNCKRLKDYVSFEKERRKRKEKIKLKNMVL